MNSNRNTEILAIVAISIVVLIFSLYILYCIYVVICSMRDESIFFGLIDFNDRKIVKNPVNIIYDNNDIISRTTLSPTRVYTRTKGPVAEPGNRYFFSYKYTLKYGQDFAESVTKNTSYLFVGTTVLNEQSHFTFEENKVVGTIFDLVIPIGLFDYFDDTQFKITVERTIGYSNFPSTSTSRTLMSGEYIISSNTVTIVSDVLVTSNTFEFTDTVSSL